MSLVFTVINDHKIIAQDFLIEALTKAHAELVALKIGYGGKLGFVLASDRTGSWRSEAVQRELFDKGASLTMWSNHRRGTAVDCAADWTYIKAIKPTMNKYGLVNDLAYTNKAKTQADDTQDAGTPYGWDGGHFQWKSNVEATHAAEVINVLPMDIKSFNMPTVDPLAQYEGQIIFDANGKGAFAVVMMGQKRIVSEARAGLVAIHPIYGGKRAVPVTPLIWSSFRDGAAF